jgi:hypothetical protein
MTEIMDVRSFRASDFSEEATLLAFVLVVLNVAVQFMRLRLCWRP